MFIVTARLVGKTPYSSSKAITVPKKTGETGDAFDTRTWREHIHVDPESGEACIPRAAVKQCICDCARFLSESVPGKGKATFTKHFEAGMMTSSGPALRLGITPEKVEGEKLYLPSDGKKGGGKRVWKTYPKFWPWAVEVVIHCIDPVLTPEVVIRHLQYSGDFIGLGRWRPRNGGEYGRFAVEQVRVTDAEGKTTEWEAKGNAGKTAKK